MAVTPEGSSGERTIEALRRELAAAIAERDEARAQQAAAADILRLINASPGDLTPVFRAILEKAHSTCGAEMGSLFLWDGNHVRAVVTQGYEPEIDELLRQPHPAPDWALELSRGGRYFHRTFAGDRAQEQPGHTFGPRFLSGSRIRTNLLIPLRKDGAVLGFISANRREVRPYSDKEIALIEDFAAQAVLAMENARLLGEVRESLDQQTATADILHVISQSPDDVQPVLDVMVKAAQRFCGAEDVVIGLRNGDELIIAAHDGPILRPPSPRVLERTSTLGRAILDACTVHVPDTSQLDPAEWDVLIQLTQRAGVRSLLAAPMLKDGSAVGAIMLRRREAGAFTDRQAALLESFAAQAVIAIENVRLFTELRESLDQQTATADILRVISQSPTDVQPVLDVVAEAARRFCGANDVVIGIREGDELRIAAHEGPLGVPPERRALDRSSAQGRAVIDGRTVHVPDFTALDPAEWGKGLELSRTFGFNSAVAAPMLRDGQAVGTVFLRRPETGPFSERQVALLENFAAQAVIAIENVRLFTELRESLDQQTATSDILRVISQSPTDVTPVFDAIAERARVLCGALLGATTRFDGELMHLVGYHGVSPQAEAIMRSSFPRKPDPSSINGRCILARAPIQIPDVTADPHYQLQDAANAAEYRALVAVPMLQGSEVIGVIAVTRREPGAFPPKLVELLQTFAAQGVIAIENVRLFTELRDSLERLKAAQANLVQSEKMASLGQLTAGIAHEIKNPLNFVNNFATLSVDLLDELKEVAGPALATLDEEARAGLDEVMELLTGNLTKIAEHGKRADGIVKSMLSHSRGGSGDWASSDINALVEEALNLAYHGARAQDKEFNVTLERELDKGCGPIEVVPQDVMRVFLNLFGNGFYAANKRRTRSREAGFRPTLRVATRDLGDAVEVCVRDNGIGMPPEVKAKLFQPFFTTKPTGEGTGLGLSISYDIVTQQHGGTIDVASEPDDYTEFTVRLPRARRTGAAARGA